MIFVCLLFFGFLVMNAYNDLKIDTGSLEPFPNVMEKTQMLSLMVVINLMSNIEKSILLDNVPDGIPQLKKLSGKFRTRKLAKKKKIREIQKSRNFRLLL